MPRLWRWVEQLNLVVMVQSQEASRAKNIPHSYVGRLDRSVSGIMSRRREGKLLESTRDFETDFPHAHNSIRRDSRST